MTDRARTVFLGTGSFAVPILASLAKHPAIDLTAVVTAPQRPGSRGRPTDPPVAVWAAQQAVPMLRPARLRDADAVAAVAAYAPDLLVLADYGQIVPQALLDLAGHGALNLHPSLLPRHRGATPIPATILAGDAETGVSLIRMDAGLDTGPIVAQSRRALHGRETAPDLEATLADDAALLLTTTVEPWLEGAIEARPQLGGASSLTRPLRRSDGRLDPAQPALQLERQVRAYQPWPGSFIDTPSGRLVVWRASSAPPDGARQVGRLMSVGDALALICGDGLLLIDEVQPAGGRRMTGAEALRGRPALDGAQVLLSADRPS